MTGIVTQGFKSNSNASLDGLLTLVVISHERPAFLRRTLQHYSTFTGSIQVLDSSAVANASIRQDFPAVAYQHLPQFGELSTQEKLAHSVQQVATPYMVFAVDNDFLLDDALGQCVDFLEGNPDHGLCHGYSLSYLSTGKQVNYYRRDKKVREDYASENARERVLHFMQNFIPPLHAVTRTALLRSWYEVLPAGTSLEFQEMGHAWYLLANAKAQILPIAYSVRDVDDAHAIAQSDVFAVLNRRDAVSTSEREKFAAVLASSTARADLDKQDVIDSFSALRDCLGNRHSLTRELLLESLWESPLSPPVRCFAPSQYVEMPFYNQPFFDQLTALEFLIGVLPAGQTQLQVLEGIWVQQRALLRTHDNDNRETITERLWQALDKNVFNRHVANFLAQQLQGFGAKGEVEALVSWVQRIDAVVREDFLTQLAQTPSGQLLDWLDARSPDVSTLKKIDSVLAERSGGPQFGILLLDLDDDMVKLQATFDSLVEGHYKSFQVVVFTTGNLPAATTLQNTVHFVKVTRTNYVDKLNQIARQSSSPWLLLAEAGDQFTASGLLRASLELSSAPDVRAVAADEIHRQADGTLVDVFRPGFNLDLLQALPAQMARHWLIRRDVLLEAGGYSADFNKALEFDLLLRVIETGGLAWLAHLDEPLLISDAPVAEENPHERLTLTRHLTTRGYKAQVSSVLPGTWRVDYRHVDHPLVSIIIPSQDNLDQLKRCVASISLRTRYSNYEVLIADNHSQSEQTIAWLAQQSGRVRVLRSDSRISSAALGNWASKQAKGDYLVLLSADSEQVNPNWIESLLNQAQRPEVGVVGVKLVDRQGLVTQAGLILGMNGGVSSAFVGEPKNASGYLHRLLLEQNYSAVSAACLMVRKALYEAVGGLDEGDSPRHSVTSICA